MKGMMQRIVLKLVNYVDGKVATNSKGCQKDIRTHINKLCTELTTRVERAETKIYDMEALQVILLKRPEIKEIGK